MIKVTHGRLSGCIGNSEGFTKDDYDDYGDGDDFGEYDDDDDGLFKG